ncbi:hypothetical protein NDU88_009603 [Pleurodeles waltl]|uniref:Uncharacterized protein n=1 Tax=Pleurodeles waltl TaxID=8319 RepID=A0AAV7PTQ1_PLEWA|nr:hypothetical protein NDU88_009603 [Pleurodeles waltl]
MRLIWTSVCGSPQGGSPLAVAIRTGIREVSKHSTLVLVEVMREETSIPGWGNEEQVKDPLRLEAEAQAGSGRHTEGEETTLPPCADHSLP